MKNEWEKVKIGDITEKIVDNRGKTPKNNPDKGIPLLEVNALSETRKNPTYEVVRKYVDIETYKNSFRSGHPQKGDILIPTVGTIGNVCMADNKLCCIAQNVIGVRTNRKLCVPEYLYYTLKNKPTQKRLLNLDIGGVQPSIKVPHLLNLEILLPDIKIQQQIVSILSALDDKIELNTQINHNLEEQAKAIFKSWFVDFEPFRDGKFVDSELGQIPVGWRIGVLSEIADITMGQSPKGSSYNEDSVGTVFYQGRAEFTDRFPARRLFTTEPKRMAEKGDVLLSVRAPVGDMNIANENCCIGRGLAAIHAKKAFSSFVFYTMQALKPELDKYNGEGTVFGCVNKDALNTQKIIIPSDSVISDFEKIASPLDQKYLVGFEENMRLTQLRDTLLPKLMSGEIDVSEVEV